MANQLIAPLNILNKNNGEVIKAGDLKNLIVTLRDLITQVNNLDPVIGTVLADTITEFTAGLGTTFTTKALFSVPNAYSTVTGITAGTTQTQAGATLLTAEWNNVTTVATTNDGVRLPSAATGLSITVKNTGTNVAKVYPFLSDFIDDELVNVAITIAVEQEITFKAINSSTWESNIETESLTVINAVTGNITTVNSTTITADGSFVRKGLAATGFGLLSLKSVTAIKAFAGGATEVIPVQIPGGAKIVGCQLRNDTILVGAGATSYSAAYSTGSTQSISAATLFTKNNKVNTFFNANGATDITTNLTDITLTPNAGTLDTGTVTAVVYYYDLTSLTSVA